MYLELEQLDTPTGSERWCQYMHDREFLLNLLQVDIN